MVVVLVGFMGAGKTTVGHIMAERLGQPFVDSDVLIEQRLGRDIRDIFRTEGEPYFRQLEHATVAALVRGQDAVIALGGGAVEDPRTRAVLRDARVVYLRVGYDEAMARVKSDEFRPMLHRPGLDEVYKRRLPVYEDLSVLTVDTDGRRPDAVALEVLAQLTRLPETPPGSSPPVNRVAASLAPEDTDSCLRELDRLAPRIGLAEVRLDLMRASTSPSWWRSPRSRSSSPAVRSASAAGSQVLIPNGWVSCAPPTTTAAPTSTWKPTASTSWPAGAAARRPRSSRPSTGSTRCRPILLAPTANSATAAPWSSWWAPRSRPPTCSRCWNCCATPARRSSAWPWAPRAPAPASWPPPSRRRAHLRRRHLRRGHRPRPDHRRRDDGPLRPPPRHPEDHGVRARHPAR